MQQKQNRLTKTQKMTGMKYYLGSLPGNTKKGIVRNYFASFGKVIEVKLVKHRKTKKCSGFGFLTLVPNSGIDLCNITHNFMNRVIKVEEYLSGETLKSHTNAHHKRRLFVTKINSELTDYDLSCYFKRFGALESAYRVKIQSEGKPTNYGYITFKESKSADCFFKSAKEQQCSAGEIERNGKFSKWVEIDILGKTQKSTLIRVFPYQKWIEKLQSSNNINQSENHRSAIKNHSMNFLLAKNHQQKGQKIHQKISQKNEFSKNLNEKMNGLKTQKSLWSSEKINNSKKRDEKKKSLKKYEYSHVFNQNP